MSDQTSNGEAAAPIAEGAPESEPKTIVYPRVKSAIALVKRHPLKAVALGAAAIASLEVELAVGILAGIGATALLATKPGSATREEVLSKSKAAFDKARSKLKRKEASPPIVSAGDAGAS